MAKSAPEGDAALTDDAAQPTDTQGAEAQANADAAPAAPDPPPQAGEGATAAAAPEEPSAFVVMLRDVEDGDEIVFAAGVVARCTPDIAAEAIAAGDAREATPDEIERAFPLIQSRQAL